jgi:hypothetical protein
LRTYAIWDKNKKIFSGLAIYLILSAVPAMYYGELFVEKLTRK